MRRTILTAVIASLAACATADDRSRAGVEADNEAGLARATAGRTAGPPQQCVQRYLLGGNRGFGRNVIVFDGPGQTVYVNRTRGACPRITDWDTVTVRTTGSSLCSNDIIHVVDLQTGVEYGSCSLGDFTPFRREG